jgi:hypothetical protein
MLRNIVEFVWVVIGGIALMGVDEQDGISQMATLVSGHPHRLQSFNARYWRQPVCRNL